MARALDALAALEAAEGEAFDPGEAGPEPAEIACEGLACWIGTHRTSHGTVDALLRLCLLSDVSDEGGIRRLRLSEAGRAARRRPAIVAEISAALAGRRQFGIEDDRVVALPGEPPLTGPAPVPPG